MSAALTKYSSARLWLYLLNYTYGRYTLINAQTCLNPRVDRWWYVRFSFGSTLGIAANTFIWVDTVVWAVELALGSSSLMRVEDLEEHQLLHQEEQV